MSSTTSRSNKELQEILSDLDCDMLRNYLVYNKVIHKDVINGFKMISTDSDDDEIQSKKMECMKELYKHMRTVTPLYNKLSTSSFIGLTFAFKHLLISPSQYMWKQKEFDPNVVMVLENEKWRNAIVKANQAKTKTKCIKLFSDAIEKISFIGAEDYSDIDYVMRFAKILVLFKIRIKADIIAKHCLLSVDEVYAIIKALKIT
jgi:hypothetical protein